MSGRGIIGVGLDIGSARTRCVVLCIDNGQVRYLGHGEVDSRGWVKSQINDQSAVTDCILPAVEQAERTARMGIESAVVGVGGVHTRGASTRAGMPLGRPREIETGHVKRIVEEGAKVQLQDDRMVLQVFPQDFVVDGHPGHRDPRKMLAYNLEVNLHLVTTSVQEHTAIVSAVNQAHLAVEETVFEPIAACYATVLPSDREAGVALVDIGKHSSSVVLYYGDALQLATSLPISGDHFTRDVARGLCISVEDAALVKEEYGAAISTTTAGNSYIEIPSPDDRGPREARRKTLNEILEARAEEFFDIVLRELVRVGMDKALIGGVVLTGGGAKLPGLCDIAERVLTAQARKGLVFGVKNWPEEIDDPTWNVAAGLAMYSAKLKARGGVEKPQVSLLGKILQ